MIDFLHPEYLRFLWAIPVFALLYGLLRLYRKRKGYKSGSSLHLNEEESKLLITKGWFIFSVFSLVYAIVLVGLASPEESEESSRQYESKEVQMMLAFDDAGVSETNHRSIRDSRAAITKELDEFRSNGLNLSVGAISSNNLSTIHNASRDFKGVSNFILETVEKENHTDNLIARFIRTGAFDVKWPAAERSKKAVVIFSDRETMTRPEIDDAKKAIKAAAKRHIFTYIIGVGEKVDSPDLLEIANAGKGAYIEDEDLETGLEQIVHMVKKNKRITFIDVLNYFLLVIFFLVTPSLVIYLCTRYSWLGKLGPIIVLYGVGMLVGNIKVNGASLFPNELGVMQNILSTAMVPLAIPLMLYSCTFNKKLIGKHLTAMLTGLVGVIGAVVIAYLICGKHVTEANKVAGMMTGMYTGGTINMAAIKESLQADNQTYILMQTYDIVICLAYLLFLLFGGFKIFRKWLSFDSTGVVKKKKKKTKLTKEEEAERAKLEEELRVEEVGFLSIFSKQGFKNTLILLGVTLAIVALSALLTLLVSGGQLNMTIFFLLITTFGIMASSIKNVHNRRQHYNIGLYCIYIFSLVIATMADFDSVAESLTTDFWLPGFAFIAVFGSLLLSALLAKIFKVDADTMVITSVTYINSPAFVPMIAAAMRNRNVLIPGLTIGVVGFAVGNYLGTLLAFLLP